MKPEFRTEIPADWKGIRIVGVPDLLKQESSSLSPAVREALNAQNFTGAPNSFLPLILQEQDRVDNLLLAGLGDVASPTPLQSRRFGALLADAVRDRSAVLFRTEDVFPGALPDERTLMHVLSGFCARQYSFDRYRSDGEKTIAQRLVVVDARADRLAQLWERQGHIVDAALRVKDLVSEPPNVLYPESMADMAAQLKNCGLDVTVFDEKALAELGMGALLGVGQGSARPPRLVVLRWTGDRNPDNPPIVVAGKGITFDAGGLSLKTRPHMRGMKNDMAGAAVVMELLRCAAENRLPLNVVGILALAENMPSGKALRPDDIIRTMSGKYVEILSADGEGRLVLCDALWYAVSRLNPSCVIDIATLTGAMSTALGWQKAGLFCNDDALADDLYQAGEQTSERLWRMPIDTDYDDLIPRGDADMENATFGQNARSIFAAKFLEKFVDGRPWAHIDIAGTAWSEKDTPMARKGATAFGLQLLYQFLEKRASA